MAAGRRVNRDDDVIFLHPYFRWVLGPGFTATAALVDRLPIKLPLLVAGLGLVAAGNIASDRKSTTLSQLRAREDAQFNLTKLLQHSVTFTEAAFGPRTRSGTLRANVMLPFPEIGGAHLKIAYYTQGYQLDELGLLWARGQGVVGEAWDTESPQLAPRADELPCAAVQAENPTRPWNMTREQVRATAERISAIWAVPLISEDDRHRLLAVVSVDDSRSLAQSPIGLPTVQEATVKLASGPVRELLEVSSYRFPEDKPT